MNYGELKTAVSGFYFHSQIDSTIPTFVRLAESVLRRDVRVPAMESLVVGSMDAGVIALPADYVDARRLVVDGYPCTYKSAEEYQLLETEGAVTSGSAGRYFTRIGNAIHVLNGGTGAYSLLYSSAFDALSDDADTNWLLTNAADAYLFKVLFYAAVYMKDAAAAQGYEALYSAAKEAVNDSERVNAYSGGSLSMPSRAIA